MPRRNNDGRLDGRLEVLRAEPAQPLAGMPPLLFVHGAYTAAWCWQEYWLPAFAAAGFSCHALSLSGHGGSGQRDQIDQYAIKDYVADVAATAAALPAPPVLIGHSMGGFVVQKYLEQYSAAAAVLLSSAPPQGLALSAVNMFFGSPGLLVELNRFMSGGGLSMQTLQEAMFATSPQQADLRRYHSLAQPESHRAIWDMTLFNLPLINKVLGNLPHGREDLYIAGGERDLIIAPSLVALTAVSYGVKANFLPDIGHAVMLETNNQQPAAAIMNWLQQRFPIAANIDAAKPAAV